MELHIPPYIFNHLREDILRFRDETAVLADPHRVAQIMNQIDKILDPPEILLSDDIWHTIIARIRKWEVNSLQRYKTHRALSCVSKQLARIWKEEQVLVTLSTIKSYIWCPSIRRSHYVRINAVPKIMIEKNPLHGSQLTTLEFTISARFNEAGFLKLIAALPMLRKLHIKIKARKINNKILEAISAVKTLEEFSASSWRLGLDLDEADFPPNNTLRILVAESQFPESYIRSFTGLRKLYCSRIFPIPEVEEVHIGCRFYDQTTINTEKVKRLFLMAGDKCIINCIGLEYLHISSIKRSMIFQSCPSKIFLEHDIYNFFTYSKMNHNARCHITVDSRLLLNDRAPIANFLVEHPFVTITLFAVDQRILSKNKAIADQIFPLKSS